MDTSSATLNVPITRPVHVPLARLEMAVRHRPIGTVRVVQQALLHGRVVEAPRHIHHAEVIPVQDRVGPHDPEPAVDIVVLVGHAVSMRAPGVRDTHEHIVGRQGRFVGLDLVVVVVALRGRHRGRGRGRLHYTFVEHAIETRDQEHVRVDKRNPVELGHVEQSQLGELFGPARAGGVHPRRVVRVEDVDVHDHGTLALENVRLAAVDMVRHEHEQRVAVVRLGRRVVQELVQQHAGRREVLVLVEGSGVVGGRGVECGVGVPSSTRVVGGAGV